MSVQERSEIQTPPGKPPRPASGGNRGRALAGAGVLALAVGIAAVVGSGAFAPIQYTATEEGIDLGPARQRNPSAADGFARTARDALNAAAGSAGGVPLDLKPSSAIAPPEQQLLDLANQERVKVGLAPLDFDPATLGVARVRAVEQVAEGATLSHFNATGELAFFGLLSDANVPYSVAGENLARSTVNDGTVVTRLHAALMKSPTHRENILFPGYTTLSVGAAGAASGKVAFAQIFRAE